MKHPQYLSEVDKYNLSPVDFPERYHRHIFVAIDSLYRNGARKIQPIDVENFLQSDSVAATLFKQHNGIEYLQDAEYLAEETNFEFYYKRLKKINLLNSLKSKGIDISDFYIEDLTNPKALDVNRNFENLSIDDILEEVKKKILTLEHTFIQNEATHTESAFHDIQKIIDDAGTDADIGLPLQGDILTDVLAGARLGTLMIRSAGSGTGKALPNSIIIPTPKGYRRVDEIKVGDYLFDAFGKPTKVLGVYPQGRKEVNFVRFKDGRVSLCCDEHLWSYCTVGQKESAKKSRKFYTKTLKELKQEKLKNDKGAYNILVPMNYAVNYPEHKFYIPPYIFGLALGDGSFRQHETNKSFQFSSEDEWLPNYIANTMGWYVKKSSEHNFTWYFSFKKEQENQYDKVNIWVQDFLKDYPELIDCKSENKFIPSEYLFSSVKQRFDLLSGLLDSDGTVDTKGRIRYTTNSSTLRDNVIDLAHSLGFKTTCLVDSHKKTSICYNIEIIGRPDDKVKLFKLPRKKELIEQWYNSDIRKEFNEFNPIVEIGSCGYTEEMTCFYVDNKEHLFLTNDYIVTHNTRQAVGDACLIAFPFRYEELKDSWVQIGNGKPVLFIATEQSIIEIQKMILAYLTGFNESKFRYGNFTPKEERILRQAVWIMEQYKENFFIVQMPNPRIDLVKNLVREQTLLHNIKYVFFDYIFICPSLLGEFKGVSLRNDEILLMFSTALKELAVELHICMFTSTQVNANADQNTSIRNESSIAGSRAVINKADVGMVCARPTAEELKAFQEMGEAMPNLVTDIYKVRSGAWTQVRIWSFIDLGNLRKVDLFMTDSRLERISGYEMTYSYNDWDNQNWYEQLKKVNEIE